MKNKIEKYIGSKGIHHSILKKYNITSEEAYLMFHTRPLCKICGCFTSYINFNKGYRIFCSNKCSMENKRRNNIGKKISDTWKSKSIEEIKDRTDKTKATKLFKYGNENYNNIEKIVKSNDYTNIGIKSKETWNKKTERAIIDHIDKIKDTKLNKYGDKNYNNIEKSRQTQLNKYGDLYLSICDRSNWKYYKQQNHKNMDLLNKDYIEKNFIKNKTFMIEDLCYFYGFSYSFANKLKGKFNIKYINSTGKNNKTEKEIAELFNNPIMNSRQIISPLELDLYSKENKLAIEYNGLMWHSYGKSEYSMFNNYKEENKKKHLNKTILCEEKGIQLYHIFENEWLNKDKKDIWISMIKDKQGLNKKIGARKCIIKEVQNKEAKEFIDNNHMQGYINASIKIGLYYDDILYSIMTFGKSRYNKNIEYELIRFCTKKGYTVQGGGSRILKYFEKTYKPKSLISYANRRWSMGNFYIKSGFTFIKDTIPNYFYFLPKENILWSRNKFQKHKLSNILKNFNKEDTETINMYNNGYRKIYDCGNKVFLKEY